MIPNSECHLISKMIKQVAKADGDENCKKAHMAREKKACTQAMVTDTGT